MYIQEGSGGRKSCNDSERQESTEERVQCKKQYTCTPNGTLALAMVSRTRAWNHRKMNNAIHTMYGIIKTLSYCFQPSR